MSNNLVLFSGGRDSSYLTYKLLADTSDDITLLIAASANGTCDGLTEQKLLNIQPLLKELKKIRDFRVKYLKVNSSEITSFSLDRWNSYLITKLAPELNNGTYDKLTIGSTWEQNDGAFFKHSTVRGLSTYIDSQKIFADLVTQGEFSAPLITNDIEQNFNRWHVLQNTPENIKRSTIACDGGFTEDNKCGQCNKCLYDNVVQEHINNGYTASDVDEWRQEKSHDYTGSTTRDCSFINWIYMEKNGNFPIAGKRGVAEDAGDVTVPDLITTKQQFRDWYSTFEYNWKIDRCLIKWGLDKTGWNPEA